MSVSAVIATMQGSLRRPKDDLRGADLARHFEALRKRVELTRRAKVSGSLLVTAVAAMLGYGYLGPTLSDLISSTALVLLAAASNPFFRGGAPVAADPRQ